MFIRKDAVQLHNYNEAVGLLLRGSEILRAILVLKHAYNFLLNLCLLLFIVYCQIYVSHFLSRVIYSDLL